MGFKILRGAATTHWKGTNTKIDKNIQKRCTIPQCNSSAILNHTIAILLSSRIKMIKRSREMEMCRNLTLQGLRWVGFLAVWTKFAQCNPSKKRTCCFCIWSLDRSIWQWWQWRQKHDFDLGAIPVSLLRPSCIPNQRCSHSGRPRAWLGWSGHGSFIHSDPFDPCWFQMNRGSSNPSLFLELWVVFVFPQINTNELLLGDSCGINKRSAEPTPIYNILHSTSCIVVSYYTNHDFESILEIW